VCVVFDLLTFGDLFELGGDLRQGVAHVAGEAPRWPGSDAD